MLFLDLQFI